MKKELVSIIMPTYNRKNVVKRAIDSCLQQSYQNIEVIICDDHSTDGTEEYISKLREQDNRIVYCKTPMGHKGANAARNAGIRIANGEYICFLDSDDELLKNGIENRINVFKKNPKIGMVYGNALCQMRGKTVPWIYDDIPQNKREARKYLLCELSLCCQITIMFRKKVLDRIGLLNEEQKGWTDDGVVVAIGLEYPMINCGKFVAVVHKSDVSMSSNKQNLYQGLVVLVKKYKMNIIREVSIWRYILWKIRIVSAYCYAQETTVDSYIMRRVWKFLHEGLKWFWYKGFRHKFE